MTEEKLYSKRFCLYIIYLMFLKRLEIIGFKSFASKTILDFPLSYNSNTPNLPITAVVGPNGSGKSNIADGIRWALGEQSYKNLRTKKSEEVIFTGTQKKSKASYSEVSLWFDNSLSKAPLSFQEIVITRRIYRSSENEYFINKSKVRLIDIQHLLAQSGFGQSTYTVISQGAADEILFFNPKERKIFFDEAAGVKKFELKKEESLRRIEAADQNILRIKDIFKEISPQLNLLRRQVKRSEEKEKLFLELKEFQEKYYYTRFSKIFSKLKSLAKNKEEIEKEILEVQKEKEAQEKNLKEQESKRKADFLEINVSREKLDKLSQEKDQVKEKLIKGLAYLEVDKKNNQPNLLKEKEAELAQTDNQIQKLLKEAKELEISVQNQKKVLEKLENQIEKEEVEIKDEEIKKSLDSVLKDQKLLIQILENPNFDKSLIKEKTFKIYKLLDALNIRIKKRIEKSSLESLLYKKRKIIQDLESERLKLATLKTQKEFLEKRLENLNQDIKKMRELSSKNAVAPVSAIKINALEEELKAKEKEIEILKESLRVKEAEQIKENVFSVQQNIQSKQNVLSQFEQNLTEIKISMARFNAQKDDLTSEIKKNLGSSFLKNLERGTTFDLIDESKLEMVEIEIDQLRGKLSLAESIDPEMIKEYEILDARNNFLSSQLIDLEKARVDFQKIISRLDVEIKGKFEITFDRISAEFDKYFKIIFNGGQAGLYLDPEGGIEIKVSLPGKRTSSLQVLSGGEKSLTALSLLFAILTVNPSPFCILDEVDAALDEINTQSFLKIIKNLKETQFIFITHNRETIKASSILYGVTMEDHISKIVSLKLEEINP